MKCLSYLARNRYDHRNLTSMMRYIKKFTVLCLFTLCIGNGYAMNANYGISTTFGTYTNINRRPEPDNPQREKSIAVSPFISISEDSPALLLNLNARSNLIFFETPQNSDRNITNVAVSALIKPYPSQFEWFMSDVFTQTAIDALQSTGLSNRQDVNIFDIGPNFIFRLAPRNTMRIEPRIQNTIFEISGADNLRFIVGTTYAYELYSYFNFTLNYDFEKIDYEDQQRNINSVRNDIYFTSNYERAGDSYELEIGLTNLNFDGDLIETQDELRFRFNFERQLNRISNIRFLLNNSLDDVSRNLRNELIPNPDSPVLNVDSSDFFLNESMRLIYNVNYFSWNFNVETFFNSLDYNQQTNLSRNQTGLILGTNLVFSSRSSIGLALQYRDSTFDETTPVEREDIDISYSITYNYRLNRNLSISILVRDLERDSSLNNQTFEDTSLFFSLSYTSG